uniref:C3H1-type domain-containing protein n=1 Tax=Noctiluca scintillans TaxID=2966 RepID=A0A7S0ZXV0_NOCSC|mmetsp:Transcript_23585/g.62122  ORF Transcript_23585/g.62122 Transcript_23585/m.62122 type:complete len:1023 (+) Transcript_23585:92-3160(+)
MSRRLPKLLCKNTFIDYDDVEEAQTRPFGRRASSEPIRGYSESYIRERSRESRESSGVQKYWEVLAEPEGGRRTLVEQSTGNKSADSCSGSVRGAQSVCNSAPSRLIFTDSRRRSGTHRSLRQQDKVSATPKELRSQIFAASRSASSSWEQRFTKAMAVIDDIPEQLADVLLQRATSIADDMKGEVQLMHDVIVGSEQSAMHDSSVDKSLASLEAIPETIFKSFEASFSKAQDQARERVEVLIAYLGGSDLPQDHIIDQLWTIPQDVQQIAAKATDEAVQESQAQVSRLLDFALEELPDSVMMNLDTVSEVKEQIVSQVPRVYQHTLTAARAAAIGNVKHAVATVRKQDKDMQNKEVADALLRAKADNLNQTPLLGTGEIREIRGGLYQRGGSSHPTSQSAGQEYGAHLPSSGLNSLEWGRQHHNSETPKNKKKKKDLRHFGWAENDDLMQRLKVEKSSSDCPMIHLGDLQDNSFLTPSDANSQCDSAPPVMDSSLKFSQADMSPDVPAREAHNHTGKCGAQGYVFAVPRTEDTAIALTYDQRLSAALSAIDIIPEQLVDVLKQKALDLVAGVETELEAVRVAIRYEESRGQVASSNMAVASLDKIPHMILSSFEAKLATVKSSARQRIDRMTYQLENSNISSEDIVSQLWAIPEEVQQIASDAIEEAVQESQDHASRQLNFAMQSLSEDTALSATELFIERVPNIYPEMLVEAATASAAVNIKHAVNAVDTEQEFMAVDAPQHSTIPMSTQVGAGVPLVKHPSERADPTSVRKALGGKGGQAVSEENAPGLWKYDAPDFGMVPTTTLASQSPGVHADDHIRCSDPSWPRAELVDDDGVDPMLCGNMMQLRSCINPGSLGHPELCPRPCLYFPVGQCANGAECDFCHRPHSKRPAHLDKRHRETLRAMTSAEVLSVMHPILKQKVESLCLSPHVEHSLSRLGQLSQPIPPTADPKRQKEARALRSALTAMSLRSLLTTLHRTSLPAASPERDSIDGFRASIDVVLRSIHGRAGGLASVSTPL